jgi:hypothetical protein
MRDDAQIGHTPIVLISATLRDNEMVNPSAWGAASFLREPVAADMLAAMLRRAVEGA